MSFIDPHIRLEYAGHRGIDPALYSIGTPVSVKSLFDNYVTAAARIAELEARIAEFEEEVSTLMLTPPLPEWTGKRLVAIGDNRGVTAHTFGTSRPAVLHEVMPGAMGRPA